MISVKRLCRHMWSKVYGFIHEKTYRSSEGEIIKYILKAGSSKKLVIVFSAFTPKGITGKYNYIRTLKNCPHNQLFILDQKGYDKRGNYYLGRNKIFTTERGVVELIKKIMDKKEINSTITIGSSKGGYAALLIGLQLESSSIIVGAPQYYLSEYLLDSENEQTFFYIMGDRNAKNIDFLNNYLRGKIYGFSEEFSGSIFMSYSINDHTYEEHILGLLEDLESNKYSVSHSIDYYSSHSDIGLYFPKYILKVIEEC